MSASKCSLGIPVNPDVPLPDCLERIPADDLECPPPVAISPDFARRKIMSCDRCMMEIDELHIIKNHPGKYCEKCKGKILSLYPLQHHAKGDV